MDRFNVGLPNNTNQYHSTNQYNQSRQYNNNTNPTTNIPNHQMFDNDRELAQAIGAHSAAKENQELLEQGRAKRFRLCHKMLGSIGSRYNHLISDFRKLNINLSEVRKVNTALFEAAKARLVKPSIAINEGANNQYNKFKRNYDSFVTTRMDQYNAVKRTAPMIANINKTINELNLLEVKCGQYLKENHDAILESQRLQDELNAGREKLTQSTSKLTSTNEQLDLVQQKLKTHQEQFQQCQEQLNQTRQQLENVTEQIHPLVVDEQGHLNNLGADPTVHLVCFLYNFIHGDNSAGDQFDIHGNPQQREPINCDNLIDISSTIHRTLANSSLNDDNRHKSDDHTYSITESPFEMSFELTLAEFMKHSQGLHCRLEKILSTFQSNFNQLTNKLEQSTQQLLQLQQQYEELQQRSDDLQCDSNDAKGEVNKLRLDHHALQTTIDSINIFFTLPSSSTGQTNNVDHNSMYDNDETSRPQHFISLSKINAQLKDSQMQIETNLSTQKDLVATLSTKINATLVSFKDELNNQLVDPSHEYANAKESLEEIILLNETNCSSEDESLQILLTQLSSLKSINITQNEALSIAQVHVNNAGKIDVDEEKKRELLHNEGHEMEVCLDGEIEIFKNKLIATKLIKPMESYRNDPNSIPLAALETSRAYSVSSITSQLNSYNELLTLVNKDYHQFLTSSILLNDRNNLDYLEINKNNASIRLKYDEFLNTLASRGFGPHSNSNGRISSPQSQSQSS